MALRGPTHTLSQLVADLGVRMDDTTHVRWSLAQKELAFKSAVQQARGLWWEDRRDDVHTYAEATFEYSLPPAWEGVQAVYLQLSDDEKPQFIVPSRWHIEQNNLVFDRRISGYDGATLYIDYIVYPSNLLSTSGTDGAFTDTDKWFDAAATFVTDGVVIGDTLEILNPYEDYAFLQCYVKEVMSETLLVIHNVPTVTLTTESYTVAGRTDMPYMYLTYAAMAELYEMASRNRPGVEVREYTEWAAYYRQLADREIRKEARHLASRRRY